MVPALCVLSACQNSPEWFPLPVQRQAVEETRSYRAAKVIQMGDPAASASIVQDIEAEPEGGAWRWTGKRPTIRTRPRASDGIHFVADFTINDTTFKDTGPVTVSFFAADHLIGTVHCDRPGPQHVDRPLPPDWIVPGQDLLLAAEIDKVWVSKADGAKLGFVLTSMGLTQP
jgi:hypothetical protein